MSKSDPISQLQSKFKDSLFERGLKRQQDNTVRKTSNNKWAVDGQQKLNDTYDSYSVIFDQSKGKYRCSCYSHSYGKAREKQICSHVMAVIIQRRLDSIKDGLDKRDKEKPLETLVDKIWPHESYRANQKEIIIDCLETLFEKDKDYFCISAPTGFGKSPVCYTLSYLIGLIDRNFSPESNLDGVASRILQQGFEDSLGENGYYVTPQNILLDQLESDYGELGPFGMLKGRRHYDCGHGDPDETCADGPCRYDDDLHCNGYDKAKKVMFQSPVANTNFTMFMIHPQIDRRPGLVVDEAHMMPEYVLSKVSVELREDTLNEWDWDIPNFDEFKDYVEWMNPKARRLKNWCDETSDKLKQATKKGNWNKKQKRVAKKIDRTTRLYRKMEQLCIDWANEQEPWVVKHNSFFDERKHQKLQKVTFQPITPYRFMDGLVFSNSKKAVISSATPPQADLLGVDEQQVEVREIESEFPIDNRPIYVDTIGKMSSSNRKENVQKAALKVKSLQVGKTLVHCHTYDFAQRLNGTLQAIGVKSDNIVLQKRDGQRESYVEAFKEGDQDYFLSVNMYDGLDLKGNECRTNIMCVVPFPYLGDPQIQKRKEVEGDRFFNWNTSMRIQQAYGRSTRSKEDWSNFYILDSNFRWFFHANKDMFFTWFREAIDW